MKKTILALTLAASFPAAFSSPTVRTLTFQEDGLTFLNGKSNFEYGGLRFSPPCWIQRAHGTRGEVWMSSDHDNANCEAPPERDFDPTFEQPNDNFLGVGRPDFYIDRKGKTFTLEGLAGAGYVGTKFYVKSSKGGRFDGEVPDSEFFDERYKTPYKFFELTGPQWQDITWFELYNENPYFGWQPHQGWDDIRYSTNGVSEPSTALLIGAGGLLAFWFGRKRYFVPTRIP